MPKRLSACDNCRLVAHLKERVKQLEALVSCNIGTGLAPEVLQGIATFLDTNKIEPIVLEDGREIYILKTGG